MRISTDSLLQFALIYLMLLCAPHFSSGSREKHEQDVLILEKFMRDSKIDHVGIFSYANEEGCPSEQFSNQCSEGEKDARRGHLLAVQAEISAEIQKKYIGRDRTGTY